MIEMIFKRNSTYIVFNAHILNKTEFCFRYLMVVIGLSAFLSQLMITVSLQVSDGGHWTDGLSGPADANGFSPGGGGREGEHHQEVRGHPLRLRLPDHHI